MNQKIRENMSIPNLLSLVRIILIPLFVAFYLAADSKNLGNYFFAAAVLIASGLTDMLDGFIARNFNQITPLGKVIDPLADKLTQVAVVVCLAIKMNNSTMTAILSLFVVKEALMLIGAAIVIKCRIKLQPSRWYGKIATVVFYVVVTVIAIFKDISIEGTLILIAIAAMFMIFAFIRYFIDFVRSMKEYKKSEK